MSPLPVGESRFHALDSLRGVAALMVLCTHVYAMWPDELRGNLGWLNHTPLRLLINGSAAVTFFFVLSGFVLTLPFLTPRAPRYFVFILRRFCRIYLPFVVSLWLAFALRQWVGGTEVAGTSGWFYEQWRADFNLTDMAYHLAMTGTVQDMNLNSAIWTIICELRVALIFPLLIWFCRCPKRGLIGVVGVFALCTWALMRVTPPLDNALLDTNDVGVTFWVTGRQVPFFMLGIMLAQQREALMAWMRAAPRWLHGGIVCALVVIYCAPHYRMETALEGVAAVYGVLAVMTRPVLQNWLSVKPLLWLGRVSYSLYLVHIPVLFALFHGMGNRVSFALLAVAGLLITLTVAQAFHWLVEKPSLQLGRIVGEYFTPTVVPAPSVPKGQ